jgi:hypothetical protein
MLYLRELGLGRTGGSHTRGGGRAAHGQAGQNFVGADGQGQGGVQIGHAV